MKKSAALASIFRTVLTLCVFTFLFEPAGEAAVIRSWTDMPTDSITLYPNPYLAPSDLSAYGILKEVWHNSLAQWVTGYDGAVSNFSSLNLSSQIAPFGASINDAGMRLTFSTPIYAFGATLIATRFPYVDNPGDSFDNNEQDVSYQLVAYDLAGNEIGSVYSSSYGAIVGPVEYHTTYGGTQFMASYAGMWTDVPIHQLTILGVRPSHGELVSAVGSFSFSYMPNPAPEPIAIDIKPGDDTNSINLKSNGVVPVAILTTYDFDASSVEPGTVLFADASPVKWKMEDVDNDGDMDLLLHFRTQELNLNQDSTEAKLAGETIDGTEIEGMDAVNIVPKKKK